MSKKITKLMIIVVMTMLTIIGMQTKSHALHLANKVGWGRSKVTAGWYTKVGNNPNFDVIFGNPHEWTFCVQQGAHLDKSTPIPMIVTNYIHIEGNKASKYNGNSNTDLVKEYDNISNGVMAWILKQDDPGSAGNGSYSPIQNAVYGYIRTFLNNIEITDNDLPTGSGGFSNPDFVALATEYAQNLKEHSEPKITVQETEPTVEISTVDNTEYIKVGPYQATFTGNLDYVDVYDQDENKISPKFGIYEGENLKTADKATDIVKSGVQFYILLPIDGTTEKITKVDMGVYEDVQKTDADIWLLRGTANWQNLITTDARDAGSDRKKANYEWTKVVDLLGPLHIQKVNKDAHDVKLDGVEFKFKNAAGKYIHKADDGKITYVESENEATVFTTDENGEIYIENVIVGKYTAYEVGNSHYGYKPVNGDVEIKVSVKDETQLVENKQEKVKLSGYVWVDNLPEEKTHIGEGHGRDNHYTDEEGSNDTLLEGIPVKLLLNGEVVQEQVTGENGSYLFEDVEIEKLDQYSIEFTYDGMTYTNVIPDLDADNGSKAKESDAVRKEFNANFASIEGENAEQNTGKIVKENGETYKTIKYQRGEGDEAHKSTLIPDEEGFPIEASTTETGLNIKNEFKYGDEEIKYLNLGLQDREQVDVSLQKDVQNARVAINGFEHTYNYENRFKNAGDYEEGFNVGVKFNNTRGTAKYTRAIYKADAKWTNPKDTSRELVVGITYKLKVINESTGLKARVNTITDYYDSRYTLKAVGTKLDEKGLISDSLDFTEGKQVEGNGEYSVTSITLPTETKLSGISTQPTKEDDTRTEEERAQILQVDENDNSGENKEEVEEKRELLANEANYQDIYVYFEMNRDVVEHIAMMDESEPEEKKTLDNIAEIASYSTFDEEENPYAAIDQDSAPANMILGNEETYEDDTDTAPAFILQIGNGTPNGDGERYIKGNVFEDLNMDSKFTDDENRVQGVKVALVEIEPKPDEKGKPVIKRNGNVVDRDKDGKEFVTNDDGSYTINGFIPGNYVIRFTWGDGVNTIYNASGTPEKDESGANKTVDSRDYKATYIEGEAADDWKYKEDNPATWYKRTDPTRYSDAKDDWATRENIDKTYKDIVYGNSVGVGPAMAMISMTPKMELTVELEDYEQGATEVEVSDNFTNSEANLENVGNENSENGERKIVDSFLQYVIDKIDFGITLRPVQDIKLEKRISHLKYTLSNGQILMDTGITEDRKLENPAKGLTYLAPDGTGNGLLKLEIDSELMHGSTLEVTYEFKATNVGEIDYVYEPWYTSHTPPPTEQEKEDTIVRLSAKEIVDYLDADWGFDATNNPDWQEMTKDELDGQESIEIIDQTTGNVEERPYDIVDNAVIKGVESTNVRILKTEALKEQLKPGDSKTTNLTVSKAIASTDDIDLGNETEIIHVTKETLSTPENPGKPGGKSITSRPGNYVPGTANGTNEEDDSQSESVTVTPPTGDEAMLNNIIYSVIGIITLAILGSGIVLIKKTTLKKNK